MRERVLLQADKMFLSSSSIVSSSFFSQFRQCLKVESQQFFKGLTKNAKNLVLGVFNDAEHDGSVKSKK